MAPEDVCRVNPVLRRLVADYARRTFGVWALLFMVQVLQTSALWALRTDRMPILGAVIGAMAFFATSNSPVSVMRTLPIERRDVALFRWFACIVLPAVFICIGIVAAWLSNKSWAFEPPASQMWVPAFASIAMLGVLSVLPLPTLSPGRSNAPVFIAVWVVLALLALGGFPIESLPEVVPPALGVGGVILVAVSLGRARSGKTTQLQIAVGLVWKQRTQLDSSMADDREPFRGWLVLVNQLLRATVVLAFASIVVITLVRHFFPLMTVALPMLYASIVGVAGAVIARRWLHVMRTLQCLPIRDASLALAACLALTAPAFIACLAAAAVNWVVPAWGIPLPVYMIPVFVLIPALMLPWQPVETGHAIASSVQQWAPLFQIAVWPLWTGSLMSIALKKLAPMEIDVMAAGLTVAFASLAYFLMLYRVRSGFGLERIAEPLAAR